MATLQIKPVESARAIQERSKLIFVGELSLTGAIMPVASPLIIALAVRKNNPDAVLVMPTISAKIASCIKGLRVLGANTLSEVVDHLNDVHLLKSVKPYDFEIEPDSSLCISDVKGQKTASRVLEIAAAGGHSMLMSGPPGVGKSMLAQRLPTLLPQLQEEEVIECLAIQGLIGQNMTYTHKPPFRSPHHTSSSVAIIGGGSVIKPGEITLAHRGILFLDELPEFPRAVIESLREPLENGEVCIARARHQVVFPARFQMVAAMNPCPCGYLGHKTRHCRCTPEAIDRYQNKISGPFLDRIDLCIQLTPLSQNWRQEPSSDSSVIVRERVKACRQLQLNRQNCLNAHLNSHVLKQIKIEPQSQSLLDMAVEKLSLSGRVVHKLLRVAQTIADLEQSSSINTKHMSEALQYRQLDRYAQP